MVTLLVITKGRVDIIKSFGDINNCFEYLLHVYEPDYKDSHCYVEARNTGGEIIYALINFSLEDSIHVTTLDHILEEIEG